MYKTRYVFTGYHFAIITVITVSLSKRHCSQNETEDKYMLMNLFIPVHKCHVNTRRSFSNRYIFFLIQIRTLQYTTVKNAKSCAHNFKLFSAHFFQLLCYDFP